jgi:hypothetical protein
LSSFDLLLDYDLGGSSVSLFSEGPNAFAVAGFSVSDFFGGDGGGIDLGLGFTGASVKLSGNNVLGSPYSVSGGLGWGYGGRVTIMPNEFLVDVTIFPFAFSVRRDR